MEDQNLELAKAINLKKVFSSNIIALGYDESRKLLEVVFKNKTKYLYKNVEPEIYKELMESNSIGAKLNESIIKHKDKYPYIKL